MSNSYVYPPDPVNGYDLGGTIGTKPSIDGVAGSRTAYRAQAIRTAAALYAYQLVHDQTPGLPDSQATQAYQILEHASIASQSAVIDQQFAVLTQNVGAFWESVGTYRVAGVSIRQYGQMCAAGAAAGLIIAAAGPAEGTAGIAFIAGAVDGCGWSMTMTLAAALVGQATANSIDYSRTWWELCAEWC